VEFLFHPGSAVKDEKGIRTEAPGGIVPWMKGLAADPGARGASLMLQPRTCHERT